MGIVSSLVKTTAKKFFLPKYIQRPSPDTVRERLKYMHEFTQSLVGQHNVSKVWIQHLIESGKYNASDLKTIICYLRAPAADSISKWDLAALIHAAMEYLKTVVEGMHL